MGEPSVPHARSVKKSAVLDAFDTDKKTFAFLFDYGDEWLFEAKRLSATERDAPKSWWKMTTSKGDAPEQYPDPEEDD